jgi:urease accessory protein UreF
MTSHGLHRSLKHGLGRLTATADVSSAATETSKALRSTTRLTQVSHKAPTRLIPLPKSSVQKAGAAICALSNYGAGMLQGDSVDLNIHVEHGATLGVTTQGTSRIYSQRRTLTVEEHEDPHVDRICRIHLEGQVHEDALLVLAPDPCALFAHSSLAQRQVFQVHPTSSVVLVDWFSSGRYRNGERWEFDLLSAQTSLKWLQEDDAEGGDSGGGKESSSYQSIPFLQDSISMDYRIPTAFPDPFGVNGINSFASVILYGDQAAPVVRVCQALQDMLAARHTRIRTRSTSEASLSNGDDKSLAWLESSLAGRVYCGVSQVKLLDPNQEERVAHVARFTATTNEDLYRMLHQCLLPLEQAFGLQFYKDRIHSAVSEIAKATPVDDQEEVLMTVNRKKRDSRRRLVVPSDAASDALRGVGQNGESDAFWAAFMLSDSSMPTGSFAHSAGLEAAAQLGMIQNESDVQKFVLVATRSAMQTLTPLTMAGHRLGVLATTSDTAKDRDQFDFVKQWATLDQQAQAVMATNAPACAASLDQGKSLGRVVVQWLREQKSDDADTDDATTKRQELVQHLQHGGHLGPMMGVVGALLNLDSIQVCRLLGYCVARDMVSASVRLSLVGPLASVRLLHQVQGVVQEGLQASLLAMEEGAYDDGDGTRGPLLASATSSPVLEALHPCHDLLQVRLFRT